METLRGFCLLLLLCSLSAAEPQDISTKLANLLHKVEELQNVIQGHDVELQILQTRTNVTKAQVDSLRKDKADGQVAFSASLLGSSFGTVGPFNVDTPLIFRNVFTNTGNAYNVNTGIFTAPVRGVYHFDYFLHVQGGTGSVVGLVKNRDLVMNAHETQSDGWATAGNAGNLLLQPGDVVSLRLWKDSRIFDNENHHSTFSGHLLFPM